MKLQTRAFRMPDELYFKLKQLAKDKDRSTSKQIVRILEKFISEYEQENGEIKITDSE